MDKNTIWNWMYENKEPTLDNVLETFKMVEEQPLEFEFSFEEAYDKALNWYDDLTLEMNYGARRLLEYLEM